MKQKKQNSKHTSGKRIDWDNVLTHKKDEVHPQSRASYVRLRRYYKSISKPAWKEWLEFREVYLLAKIEIKGSLICEYCGKPDLDKDAPDNDYWLATIDHIIPLSKGGAKYDVKNFAVACSPCNRHKGAKIIIKESNDGSCRKRKEIISGH